MNRDISGRYALAASRYGKEKDYWVGKFSGDWEKTRFPDDCCWMDSNENANKNERQTAVLKNRLEGELLRRMLKISKASDYTLHMILSTALVTLLARYTGDKDIIIGIPIYKQANEGEFLNTVLPIRNLIADCMTFKDLLLQVRTSIVEANEHQNYPMETLLFHLNIPPSEEGFPLFDVVILLETIHDKKYILHTRPNMLFSFARGEEYVETTVEYNALRYHQTTVERVLGHFRRLLEQVAFNIEMRISQLDLLSADEKQRLLIDFNSTAREYPGERTIDELFADQSAKRQENMALLEVDGDSRMSYRELHEKSHRLAAYLQEKGLKKEETVGVIANDSQYMVVSILAILKAGGAYLPVNPDYPEARKQYVLADARARFLLVPGDADVETSCFRLQVVDITDPGIYAAAAEPRHHHRSNNLAYIMYTSGSTGLPKGIMVEHHSVVRLVKNSDYMAWNTEERILQTGALEFDASTFEIWGALLNGAQLYLAGKDTILVPANLKEALLKYTITTIWMTSPLFNRMVDADMEIFSRLRHLLVGGDVLSAPHIYRLRRQYPALEIINGYGPTENTTFSTTFTLDREYRHSIPIGKPIANSTAYILDRDFNLLPPGVPGELCVGGDGVARGYLNRVELTLEKFCPRRPGTFLKKDSWTSKNILLTHSPIYRTGDLARWWNDGTIEFIGRLDQQVKIRGHRIEPAEIEKYLARLDFIKDAVVVPRQDENGEKYLCAYIVPHKGKKVDRGDLRIRLTERIPDFMVPSHFVEMDMLPLTPNGKIDTRALPEPEISCDKELILPRDRVEETLLHIWSEILTTRKEAKPAIGIDSDFFEWGGHSLTATILINRVHQAFDVKIPLSEVFTSSTIRAMAQYIRGATRDKFQAIEPVEERDYYALSSAQKRLYVMQKTHTAATHYNVPTMAILQGELDKERLEHIFNELVRRHESLRTSFHMVRGEPIQKIHKEVEFNVEYSELPQATEPGGNHAVNMGATEENTINNLIRPFDLSQAPLLRAGLIKWEQTRHLFLLDIHHIVTDGTSMDIFVKEFMALYAGQELPPLKIHYKDFSAWQNNLFHSAEIKKQEKYWLQEFAKEPPLLNLPLDFSRPAKRSMEGSSVDFIIGGDEASVLKKYALDEGTTLYIVLLALYNILLSKITRQEDIVIGTSIAGRRHSDLEPLIGMFINTLALRNKPKREKSFREFLREVGERTLQAFKNQDYQFETLVEKAAPRRDASRNPLFDARFSFHNESQYEAVSEIEILGLKLIPFNSGIGTTSKFDITLNGLENGDDLLFTFEFCTKLFKEETIHRFIKYFKEIVGYVVENKDIQLKDIEISHELVAFKPDVSAIDLEF